MGRRACCCARASLSVPQEMCVAENTTPAGTLALETVTGDFSMFSIIYLCLFPSVSVRDAFISTMLAKEPSGKCKRWLYDDIKEAHFMRFLLEVIIQLQTII